MHLCSITRIRRGIDAALVPSHDEWRSSGREQALGVQQAAMWDKQKSQKHNIYTNLEHRQPCLSDIVFQWAMCRP